MYLIQEEDHKTRCLLLVTVTPMSESVVGRQWNRFMPKNCELCSRTYYFPWCDHESHLTLTLGDDTDWNSYSTTIHTCLVLSLQRICAKKCLSRAKSKKNYSTTNVCPRGFRTRFPSPGRFEKSKEEV